MNTFGPYSPIRKSDNLYFISGQIGVDQSSGDAPKGIKEQTSIALSNMQDILNSASLDMNDIVKTTIFVTDMGLFGDVNEIYEGFFLSPRPARSTVAVKELPRVGNNPILVEIEAIAQKKAKK